MSTPLEQFFARFASLGFGYRPSKTAHHNFRRLGQVARWTEGSKELKAARRDFKDALTGEFNFLFGTKRDLASWRQLCAFIRITPVPDSIEACRHRVWDAHVNLVDLVDCARSGNRVRKFDTLEELRVYTIRTGKIFPRKKVREESLLRELLREILNEYHGHRRSCPETEKTRKEKKEKGRKQATAAQSS